MDAAVLAGHINEMGHAFADLGQRLVNISNQMFMEIDQQKPREKRQDLPDVPVKQRYTQKAIDARQGALLSLFEPVDSDTVLDWEHVRAFGMQNGFAHADDKRAGSGMAGLFRGEDRGLLRWVTEGESVALTQRGKQRLAEIRERQQRSSDAV